MRACVRAVIATLLAVVPLRAQAACHVTRGGAETLIRATILLPDRTLDPGEVRVDARGRIACVGARCAASPAATRITCDDAVLSPGFINTHDHLDFDDTPPRPDHGERFAHRHEWRKGLDGHRALADFTPNRNPLSLSWTELRFLLGGTTATVGERMAPGLLRNLDFAEGLEGLSITPVTYDIFPLDDSAGIMRTRDCNYGPHPATRASVARGGAFLAHVAEGRDEAARNEFRCESSTSYDTSPQPGGGGTSHDWLMPQATLIHAVALTPADLDRVAARGARLVWSPRSNLSLYGTTMDVLGARARGIPVALGSDWLPSGSMNLNRELSCARQYDHDHLHDAIDDTSLWRMVTSDAARVAGAEHEIGSIAPGLQADLVLFDDPHHAGVHTVVRAGPQDMLLVMRGGRVVLGRAALIAALSDRCERFDAATQTYALCPEAGQATIAAMQAYAAGHALYPLAFDAAPPNEPACRTTP
ncbi:amidohydrolase [Ameyamaea chiangmaiensis NBRC 103196]|uniref:Amidohydrolase family protein n=1 Tax=Ameyamaea chiangmaiensis TaxID=442969 RepID=A0A850PF25_9PROT|nr:amidohydrolase family protein [Ameyamaea chiangmaiensis]MBS4074227.1 amidohydrolase family protein [Ameyamaea chiangmaiensis]NVN41269.1 amidohydrolase family protein [Ameyamaea chiangmaiensis]GBQ71307.1 amidohydrolase [Ameyamaea chiangmaiensis NBRC 103196]